MIRRITILSAIAACVLTIHLVSPISIAYSLITPNAVKGSTDSTVLQTQQNDSIQEGAEEITEESAEQDNKIGYSAFTSFAPITEEEFINIIDTGDIKGVAKSSDSLFLIASDGSKYVVENASTNTIQYLKLSGLDVPNIQLKTKENKNNTSVWPDSFLEFMIVALMVSIGLMMYHRYKMRSIIAHSTTPSKTPDAKEKQDTVKTGDSMEIPRVRFQDVEGVDELKEDIFRIVDCLKHSEKYEQAGARIPKGIILYGPPGTGKTLLAKAIAGEAGVPFLAAVGSDFVEKYVGVGAKRVRELYKKAKSKVPCIVFIDEVDAVAGKRGEENNSENDQTINALLSELDGFGSTSKIITICATNRLDMLDSAFTRAGRFDLKLAVGLPDKESRLRILKIHSRNKRLADDVSLRALANKTAGFSGAELEALLNEAAMLSAGQDSFYITNSNIDDAFFKIIMQGNKKKRDKIDQMNRIVAWHESGHTLAARLITDDVVNSVTIIGSSSGAGGVTFRTPKEEGLQSRKYLRDSIAVMYAGRAAEEIYLGNDDLITTGASQDIKQATSIIKQYLALYGMGEVGMLDLTQLNRDFNAVLSEASKLSKEIYAKTLKVLKDNKKILEDLANNLLSKETLDEKEIEEIINRHKLNVTRQGVKI